ncbi:LacI family DNA-binding transcriptional regulator [Puerhibacterium sp. TATVAM-FAB25]|uniref:LacI family DNA-binding transcriptional regulator n=1 Tax=Puerhibacterium sp. TATVAM-FAB25 TaxID=3093699 RepID=UPI00397B3D92
MSGADAPGTAGAEGPAPEPGVPARAPGLKDVAAEAGVSWKTVSNVVNGTGRVGDATRRRVEEAIERLGYRPSLAGRQLRRGRTHILALAVPEIDHPYFSWLAHATISAARARGYRVLIDETGGDRATEITVARGYDERLIDGILFSPLELSLSEADALRGRTPMVLLGERSVGTGGAGVRTEHVSIDNVRAAREAVAHLVGTGRRRIAFVGVEPDAPERSGVLRLRGYREELRAQGLPVDPAWELPVSAYTRAEGSRVVGSVLARIDHVDGLLCANDQLALGAMHALRRNGVRVPADVAVVGWDNIEDGRYANPTLTTVAPDVEGIAARAVAAVVDQVEGRAGEPADVVVPHRLLVRESTAVDG